VTDPTPETLPVKKKPGNPRWVKGQTGNPKGTPKNLGPAMWKYRQDLSAAIRGTYGAKEVLKALDILYQHFTATKDDGSPVYNEGWQKSADMWLDRVVGKARVEDDGDGQPTGVSRADLVVELRRTFGLTITHETKAGSPEGVQESFEGEATTRPALPAPEATPAAGTQASSPPAAADE
jgi:hypothetical protein